MFGKKQKEEKEDVKIELDESNDDVQLPETDEEEVEDLSLPPKKEVEEPKEKEDWLEDEEEFEGQLTLDVFQDEDNIIIKSTIAGVTPEKLDISINNDMLTIKGEREKQQEVAEDDYFYQECYWGSFSRSVILPMEVEADKIDAMLKDGILTIILPKSKKAKSRKIEVRPGK